METQCLCPSYCSISRSHKPQGCIRRGCTGACKRTHNQLRLNPAPFVPGSIEAAAPCPTDRVGCRACMGRMAHKNAPGSAASSRGARARGPSPCQSPGPGISCSTAALTRPNLAASPSPPRAAAASGKAPGVPASRASASYPARRARGAGRGGGGASAGGAGRGGSRAQEALGGPSRPRVPRAARTRAAAAIPLARGRERGPPAHRPGQCGPVREGAGGRVSETQSAAATTKRTCWSPAPPPPLFPHPPNGTERGPATPPPLPLPQPLASPPRLSLFLPDL